MEFLISNIGEESMDLVDEFPEFILDISPYVNEWYGEQVLYAENVDRIPPAKELICNLRYGFECGIGWKNVIREYFSQIRNLINTAKENGDEIFYKTFIFKEKFGELRDQGDFYGPARREYWDDYVKLDKTLLDKSMLVCEVCGSDGSLLKKGGWRKTLCPQHGIENEYM